MECEYKSHLTEKAEVTLYISDLSGVKYRL